MNTETILLTLVRVNLVASVAIVLVLLLRPLLLRWFGARLTYALWLVVPIAIAGSLLPERERILLVAPTMDFTLEAGVIEPDASAQLPAIATPVAAVTALAFTLPTLAEVLLATWLLIAAALLARSFINTRRLANDPSLGPALVGVLRPRLILPHDFETRFDAQQRSLILAHEEVHRVSRHTLVNALLELARCLNWFNPLIQLAALRIRSDQELACDAAVIAARPDERHAYAQALLLTRITPDHLPLGCTWTSRSAQRLSERITLLAQPSLNRRSAVIGASLVVVAGLATGYAAWAQQPERLVTQIERPAAVWTPSAKAPEKALTSQLEAQRHDSFIALAQKGNIDFVLFGTTDAEMFMWKDRGRPVWDKAFANMKGAGFGSQGTQARTLLWRMQNGELDGYQAKLVVLQAAFCFSSNGASAGRASDASSEIARNCAPILMEIRTRQPQAKILIMPPFPRGFDNHDAWQQVSKANAAAFAPLVDNTTVFYADIGERFFLADGTHNQTMWARSGVAGVGVGIQPSAFEVWAAELKPWLQRFGIKAAP